MPKLKKGKKRRAKAAMPRRRGSRRASRAPRRKQGLFSWGTSVIAWGIGLAPIFLRIAFAAKADFEFGHLSDMFRGIISDYSGVQLDEGWNYTGWSGKALLKGFVPILGAIAFKKGTSYLHKVAPVKHFLPSMG